MRSTLDRRAACGRIISLAAFAVPADVVAAVPDEIDGMILALSAETLRHAALAVRLRETRIDPFQEHFEDLLHDDLVPFEIRYEAAFAYSRECGREAAINELEGIEQVTDDLFKRLMAIPAKTQSGRPAKVRALLFHVMRDGWRGPATNLDWDKEMARALLGEFSGISAEELEKI